MRNNKNLVFGILALLVAVSAITLAYAGFTQTLNVTGQGKVVSSKWDIHFENLSSPTLTKTALVTTAPTIQSGTTIGTYAVRLMTPGDSVSYTFDVINDGNFNATLTTLTKNTPTCSGGNSTNVCNNLTYTLVYTSNNAAVSQGNTLAAGETKTMKLTLTFNSSNSTSVLPTSDITVSNLGITLLYSQSSLFTIAPTPSGGGSSTLEVGDIVTWGTESFYVVNPDDGEGNVVLLAQYNLDVYGDFNEEELLQNENVKGWTDEDDEIYGTFYYDLDGRYSSNDDIFHTDDVNEAIEYYIDELISNMSAPDSIVGRLLNIDETIELGCTYGSGNLHCSTAPFWLLNTSYWITGRSFLNYILYDFFIIDPNEFDMDGDAFLSYDEFGGGYCGLRPVIVVPASDL